MPFGLVKILAPTLIAFFSGIIITPLATYYFYKYKMWKKKTRTATISSGEFSSVHASKENSELSTPCIGGTIILFAIFSSVLIFYLLGLFFKVPFASELNFLSREQTFIPLGVLIVGAILGLLDDLLEIYGYSRITRDEKWYTRFKVSSVLIIGFLVGWWLFSKLGIDFIQIPWGGILELGIWFIPAVALVVLATFSSGVIDGIDGLSGGVLSAIFAAYAVIAYLGNQLDLAALSAVISGGILSFLWFNIPPARFYMGEVGMMPLTIVLATFAFLTNTVLLFPIIAFPLVATAFSSTSQIIAKKFGKKIFKVAPLHHHFEALGWPSYKVTMRYWVLSVMFAVLGIILFIMTK